MSVGSSGAAYSAPRRSSAQNQHRPPVRRFPMDAPFEPQRTAGRTTQRTQIAQPQASERARREIKASRASQFAMYVFLALLMALVFAQIGQLAQMAQNTKQISQLTSQIREKKGDAGNLNMRLSMQRNIKRVHDEAVGRLGMIQPQEGQIRVISPVGQSTEVQPQTVYSGQQTPVD